MLDALVTDFEARTVDPAQAGRALTEVSAFLNAHPEAAAAAFRLLHAWRGVWAQGGTQAPPLRTQEFDLKALSPGARAELAALAAAGGVSGDVPAASGAHPLPGSGWREAFLGGSAETEAQHYRHIAEQVRHMQALGAEHADGRPRRAFHQKGVGLKARFTVASTLAPELRVGLFQPGRTWDAVVRLSNAADPDDQAPNLHGLALRIAGPTEQDFLATSAPVSHVANAADQAQVGEALALGTLKGALKLLFARGPLFTVRVLSTLSKQTKKRAESLAQLSYYSRAPFRFGPVAARFVFQPIDLAAVQGSYAGPHRLTAELTHRLKAGPIRWTMALQRFVNEGTTSIEQGDSDWTFAISPPEVVGVLEIPAHDLDGAEPEALARAVEGWSFSPFNTTHHTPLGRLNRGRRVAYDASVAGRKQSGQ